MSDDATPQETAEETATAVAEEAPAAATPTADGGELPDEDTAVPIAFEEETPEPEVLASFGPVRVARVFVCERGHRTTTLWGTPEVCQARPLRNGDPCNLALYHITELPEQVQKKLNPLKASKKASKKK